MTEQSNFSIAIKTITDMAGNFDGLEKPKLAKKLTTVARNLVNIKTAQFVGGQGYWVRNTRCWDNCYRQKRATDTGKTAQEVWTSCHEEYLKSINDSDSGWEKYADTIGTFKFAGKNMKNTIKTAAQTFHKEMTDRINAGVDVGVAVHATIQDNMEKYNNSYIEELHELTQVAAYLKDNKQHKTAAVLTGVIDGLVKEAQWYRPDKWMGSWGQENVEEIKNKVSNIDGLYTNAIQDVQRGQPIQEVVDTLYNGASAILKEIQQKASTMKLKKQDAIKLFQNISTIIAATTSNPSMQTLQTAKRNLSNVVLDITQMDPMNVQEKNPYQPSGEQPQQNVPTAEVAPAATSVDYKAVLGDLGRHLTSVKKTQGDQAFMKAIDNLITQLTDAKNKANKPTGGPAPVAEAEPEPATAPTPPVAATPTPVAGPPLAQGPNVVTPQASLSDVFRLIK